MTFRRCCEREASKAKKVRHQYVFPVSNVNPCTSNSQQEKSTVSDQSPQTRCSGVVPRTLQARRDNLVIYRSGSIPNSVMKRNNDCVMDHIMSREIGTLTLMLRLRLIKQ